MHQNTGALTYNPWQFRPVMEALSTATPVSCPVFAPMLTLGHVAVMLQDPGGEVSSLLVEASQRPLPSTPLLLRPALGEPRSEIAFSCHVGRGVAPTWDIIVIDIIIASLHHHCYIIPSHFTTPHLSLVLLQYHVSRKLWLCRLTELVYRNLTGR